MPLETKPNRQEKAPFLYHGSLTSDIAEFEPRERHKPDENIGPRVYATQMPAWAAAHSWDWSSDEGINLEIKNEKVILEVPSKFKDRLNVPIYIYKLPSDSFNILSGEGSGKTFSSTEKVRPLEVERFNSVNEAVEHFGGEVVYME